MPMERTNKAANACAYKAMTGNTDILDNFRIARSEFIRDWSCEEVVLIEPAPRHRKKSDNKRSGMNMNKCVLCARGVNRHTPCACEMHGVCIHAKQRL